MPDGQDRRERKKQRTRAAILDAALDLFADRGFQNTTINDIADRADVALRTVTVHFPCKEDLLFDAEPFALHPLRERLAGRRTGETALDVMRGWMATTMSAVASADDDGEPNFWRRRAVRLQLITAEPTLRGRARADYYRFEQVLAAAIADDIGHTSNALIPRLAALVIGTGVRELYESDEARQLGSNPQVDDLLELVDQVVSFAQAGINGWLQHASEADATGPGR